MENQILTENERIDDLDCNGFCIIQNPSCFCFGMDAVLLSNFTVGKAGARVIDLGTGTGVIPLLMKAKGKGADFTGLEIQHEMAEMAERSIRLNHVEDSCRIVEGDIKNVRELFGSGSFDIVTSNPPYISESSGLLNPNSSVNIARHEILVKLEDVISSAAYLLNTGGSFNMVHKPFRIPEIIEILKRYKLEPKRMQLVQPYADKEPNMVLIEAVKGAGAFCKVLPTLVVYGEDRNYTPELLRYYGK
jgi:Predicted O-methyltransferase